MGLGLFPDAGLRNHLCCHFVSGGVWPISGRQAEKYLRFPLSLLFGDELEPISVLVASKSFCFDCLVGSRLFPESKFLLSLPYGWLWADIQTPSCQTIFFLSFPRNGSAGPIPRHRVGISLPREGVGWGVVGWGVYSSEPYARLLEGPSARRLVGHSNAVKSLSHAIDKW